MLEVVVHEDADVDDWARDRRNSETESKVA